MASPLPPLVGSTRTGCWRDLRTNQLLVMAAPPCAGKTTLVSRLREGALPSLREQVGLTDPDRWTSVDAADLARLSRTSIDRLFLHYDLLAQRSRDGFKYLPTLIDHAGSVTLLTLWTAPEVLALRSQERLRRELGSLAGGPSQTLHALRRLAKLWQRHRVLRDRRRVRRVYEEWFAFASGYPGAPHWVLDCTAPGASDAERLDRALPRLFARERSPKESSV